MGTQFTTVARRVGIVSAIVVAILLVAYMATLAIGLLTLESPDDPIGDPWFTLLEVLIISMAPALVALMVVVHAWASPRLKTLSLTAVVFMGLLAGLSSAVHFSVLTLSRQAEFAGQPWLPLFLEFTWPSVAYELDILAWDIFFSVSVLFAAPVFSGSRLAVWIRWVLVASGLLSFAGLIGVALGDMQWRNIGVVGYVPVFLVAVLLLIVFFRRALPADSAG